MDALTVWHQHPGGIAPRLQWWQESAFTMVTTFSVDTSTEVKKKIRIKWPNKPANGFFEGCLGQTASKRIRILVWIRIGNGVDSYSSPPPPLKNIKKDSIMRYMATRTGKKQYMILSYGFNSTGALTGCFLVRALITSYLSKAYTACV